jgi:hypothetical protein
MPRRLPFPSSRGPTAWRRHVLDSVGSGWGQHQNSASITSSANTAPTRPGSSNRPAHSSNGYTLAPMRHRSVSRAGRLGSHELDRLPIGREHEASVALFVGTQHGYEARPADAAHQRHLAPRNGQPPFQPRMERERGDGARSAPLAESLACVRPPAHVLVSRAGGEALAIGSPGEGPNGLVVGLHGSPFGAARVVPSERSVLLGGGGTRAGWEHNPLAGASSPSPG